MYYNIYGSVGAIFNYHDNVVDGIYKRYSYYGKLERYLFAKNSKAFGQQKYFIKL
jgi:hypothetical protein